MFELMLHRFKKHPLLLTMREDFMWMQPDFGGVM